MKRNIVFITDSGFFIPTIVALRSLIDHGLPNDSIMNNIFCIAHDLNNEQMDRIRSLSNKSSIVNVIDTKELKLANRGPLKKHDCSANETALIKFELPNIFDELDTILYLDGDIIVKNRIDDIFNLDITGYYAAAVKDAGVLYNKSLKNNLSNEYFNSGVMYLNLSLMRSHQISELLFEEKYSSEDITLMDQNVFNKVFKGKVLLLSSFYNTLYVNLVRATHFHGLSISQINRFYGTDYKSIQEMGNQAAIIHYASVEKPWKYSDIPYADIWIKEYANLFPNVLKRKKLHIKILHLLCKICIFKYPTLFIWEIEVYGLRHAILDIKKLWK